MGRLFFLSFTTMNDTESYIYVGYATKHTGGSWIYRDPAAVLDGNSVSSNWCMNGTILAYDPAWIFSDLYQ